jgi:hypothetical protein
MKQLCFTLIVTLALGAPLSVIWSAKPDQLDYSKCRATATASGTLTTNYGNSEKANVGLFTTVGAVPSRGDYGLNCFFIVDATASNGMMTVTCDTVVLASSSTAYNNGNSQSWPTTISTRGSNTGSWVFSTASYVSKFPALGSSVEYSVSTLFASVSDSGSSSASINTVATTGVQTLFMTTCSQMKATSDAAGYLMGATGLLAMASWI